MTALDVALFTPDGWFAIDATNRRVPRLVVPGLQAGLQLVGQGSVATLVGRVRDGIVVVDIDLEGDQGHAAAEAVVAWCAERDLWTLVRPSGGADGRAHVFVAAQEHTEALTESLNQLRTSLGASRRDLDARRQVRPLSAPHRSGTWTRPLGSLTDSLSALRRLPRGPARESHSPTAESSTAVSLAEALAPRRRPRRDLPRPWQEYLERGTTPPVGGRDQSRSTVEAIATGHMVRAGYTATTAWDAIQSAHPAAMSRGRASQRRWVRWVWNRAVRDDGDGAVPPRQNPEVAAAVQDARKQLGELQWTLPPRRRATLLLVGHHVIDRIERSGQLRVPVPERNLVLDTGMSDRKAIRAALHLLDGPIGHLVTDEFDPAKAVAGESSFEFEIPLSRRALSQTSPPNLHTPTAPAGLWATLPRSSHGLWRSLLSQPEGLDLQAVGRQSGLSTTRSSDLTASQERTTRNGLQGLAQVGLAACDENGLWSAGSQVLEEAANRAAKQHERSYAQVSAERAAYRTSESNTWNVARAAALKANRAREQAWWDSLSPTERTERRDLWTHRFAGLSVADQELAKATLADRRIRAGQSEADRHRQWLASLSEHDSQQRSTERASWFQGMPPPLQRAHVAAWSRHRARYGIPRNMDRGSHAVREQEALLPSGESTRDAEFMQDQLDLGGRQSRDSA